MEPETKAATLEIFYSYSHADEDLRNELEQHLSVLQRSGLIRQWHDRKIDAGAEWAGRISEHLERADIILLLVSSNFLASDYCRDVEMNRAIERHDAGSATVIPVILRPVDWHAAPFAHLQCLPADANPVTSWPNRVEAFRNVAEGVRAVVDGRTTRPRRRLPVQQRVLDAAVAPCMPVGDTAQLLAMIRRASSDGLRAVLEIEQVESITPDNVRSKPFVINFPAGPDGLRQPGIVTLSLNSPDFDPPEQSKKIGLPLDGDSEHCVFLLKPLKEGELLLKLEVLHLGVAVATRMLKTDGTSAGAAARSAWVLASMPLTVMDYLGPLRPAPAIGRLDVATPKAVSATAPKPVETGPVIRDVTQAITLPQLPPAVQPAPAPASSPDPTPSALPSRAPLRRTSPWVATAASAVLGLGLLAGIHFWRKIPTGVPQATAPISPAESAAKLAIKAPPKAKVFIDGVLQPDPLPDEISLRPGPHSVRVMAEGGLDRMTTVELRAGERTELELY